MNRQSVRGGIISRLASAFLHVHLDEHFSRESHGCFFMRRSTRETDASRTPMSVRGLLVVERDPGNPEDAQMGSGCWELVTTTVFLPRQLVSRHGTCFKDNGEVFPLEMRISATY